MSPGGDTIENELLASAKVQVALAAVTAFEDVAESWFKGPSLALYREHLFSLRRAVTGGQFESVGRSPMPGEAVEVARVSASMTHFLRGQRASVYGLVPSFLQKIIHDWTAPYGS